MYSKLHNVSGVTRVGGTYVVYVDTVKFLILWVYFHCYDLSCLQKIYPTLSMIELFIVPVEWFTISYNTIKL